MSKQQWPASMDSIHPIREYVRSEAARLGLDEKAVFRLGLAIEEITVNIIKYAYKDATGKHIEIKIDKKDEQMLIHIKDQGVPFNPLDVDKPDLMLPASQRTVGGLGVFMTREIVDRMIYERTGDHNHLVIIHSIKRA